jgi:hypothetical protein
MLKGISVFVFLLISVVLIGCQNNNLNIVEDITSIELSYWDSDEIIATFEDKEFINELVKEIDNANTSSTANMDFKSPDYKLLFKNNEDTLFELGYYSQVMKLNVEGRYWDFNKDEMYNVKLKLPSQK